MKISSKNNINLEMYNNNYTHLINARNNKEYYVGR